MADSVKNSKQMAHNCTRGVGVGLQCTKGDGGNDGEENLGAEPDDQREIKQRAMRGLHGSKNTGIGSQGSFREFWVVYRRLPETDGRPIRRSMRFWIGG